MNPERWRRIEELCHAAAARDLADRPTFLAEACGDDDELRREVESLLAGESEAEGFLASDAWRPPALAPGTKLGPHEILGLVGSGGMGEVYKARDTRLDRIVALKILPPDVNGDPERRARFTREAKTISQLNHPHICTLYDVGEAELASAERPTPSAQYLVMEFLEGETLAARLAKGPLPLAQALELGAEIADALSAAHKHGVVHRDLKPGNVMLTKAGAKLLDFGLAKLKAGAGRWALGAGDDSRPVATTSEPLTGRGVIVGTLPYMAPEQLEGRPADARTDLWALGTILYEMLAGKRAFDGDTSANLIGAILEREPEPIAERQPLTPPALDRLVRKCLAKAPDERWDSAHDVADELRWIAQTGETASTTAPGARQPVRRTLGVLALTAVVAGVSVTVTWVVAARWTAPDREVRHMIIDTNPAEGLLGGFGGHRSTPTSLNRPSRTVLALAPDGRRLVFAGRQGDRDQLYVRDLWKLEARPIPNTDGAEAPFLSPDGRWVGFWAFGALKKVALDGGGPPVEICRAAMPFGATWGDDDTIVFSERDDSILWRVSSNGGKPEAITALGPGEFGHRLPHMLPGAGAVLFTVVEGKASDRARVAVHVFGTNESKVIATGATDARYVPTGHLVYLRRGRLMAVPFDVQRLERTGDEVGLIPAVMQATNAATFGLDTGAAQVAISPSGTLAYVTGGEYPDIQRRVVWVDRTGQVEPIAVAARPYRDPQLSPDGRRIAVRSDQSDSRIWVHVLGVPESLIPITSPDVDGMFPIWTRDGERITFTAAPRYGLFWIRADGSDTATERLGSSEMSIPASWSPDGDLLYMHYEPKQAHDICVLSPANGTWKGRALLATTALERDAQVSPDGRWLAYSSSVSGRTEVYLRRFPSLEDLRPVSGGAIATSVLWARSGRELFYLRGTGNDRELVAHEIGPDGSVAPTGQPLFKLAPRQLSAHMPVPGFDVSLDGRRFLFVQDVNPEPPQMVNHVHIVENWFEELKAKVGGER